MIIAWTQWNWRKQKLQNLVKVSSWYLLQILPPENCSCWTKDCDQKLCILVQIYTIDAMSCFVCLVLLVKRKAVMMMMKYWLSAKLYTSDLIRSFQSVSINLKWLQKYFTRKIILIILPLFIINLVSPEPTLIVGNFTKLNQNFIVKKKIISLQ